jgi:hypothetical protein
MNSMTRHEAIAKIEEAIEGRYILHGFDLQYIYSFLCEDKEVCSICGKEEASVCYECHKKEMFRVDM